MPRRTRRRRWLTTIALHLTLGLVLSIAVAVAASFVPDSWMWRAHSPVHSSVDQLNFFETRGPATHMIDASVISHMTISLLIVRSDEAKPGVLPVVRDGHVPRWAVPSAARLPADEATPPRLLRILGRGWPLPALLCETEIDEVSGSVLARRGCAPLAIGSITYEIPYKPIPSGLLLNTLFYAAITLTAALSWRALRRHRRVRKGRCTACGYDLAGLDRCPECGAKPTPAPA